MSEIEKGAPAAAPQLPPGAVQEGESDAYRLTLPAFEGPLDLLLHLIRQQKIDIYDIPIIRITEQYNAYLETMKELDLEIAADYVYMAAMLILIKSKMLLPRDEEAEQGEDPRAELVDRLIEYQRFKAVAESFAELDVVRMHVWSRKPSRPTTEPVELDLSEVSLFDLIDVFRKALIRYRHDPPQAIEVARLEHRISDKMSELYEELRKRSPIRLLWYLEGRDRPELVAIFLGVLELVRLGGVSLNQSEQFGEILLQKGERELEAAEFAIYDR
jgi:segregation and condensation protein A